MSLTVHRSTHYSTPPSLIFEVKIAYMKKLKLFFSSYRKNYKIKFVGNIDAINWVKFGHPVTSIFAKNSQKRINLFLAPP